MPPSPDAQVMFVRRPPAQGATAFGHVDVSVGGREQLQEIIDTVVGLAGSKKEVEFHPDDLASDDEVLVADLSGFDAWFQEKAPWSLERTVAEIRSTGDPQLLTASGVADGGWSFYAIRGAAGSKDAIIVRKKSPTWGFDSRSKVITKIVGTELKLAREPLVAFDRSADLLVLGTKVYVFEPRRVEHLLIDADAVKARAADTTASFDGKVAASLSDATVDAVLKVCSQNANIARRVERLIRDGDLSNVTTSAVRAALPDAGLDKKDFGPSGALRAATPQHATVLIDIAADLYYQPRFSASPRRVAAYRKIR